MIDDLKADSARWEQERRQQSARSNTGGGIIASRDSNAVYRPSNSPTVQYRNSETHSSRQYYGPTEAGQPGFSDNPAYGDGPRYPGTGSPGYNGAASAAYYAQQPTPQGGFAGQPGYSNQSAQYAVPQSGNVAYTGQHPTGLSAQQEPPYITGANYVNVRTTPGGDQYVSGDQFSSSRDSRDMRDPRVPVSTMAPSRTAYATSGPPAPASAYPQSGSSSYYPQGASATTSQYPVQPQDAFFGRGAYISGRR